MNRAEADSVECRRLGVVGTLVWDTIHDRDPLCEPVEEWGGIAYALVALEAALDDTWEVVPVVKLGSDLAQEAVDFLTTLTRLRTTALQVVPEPNNRVEIRYTDDARRTERLTGGVPGWTTDELAPLLGDVDALYVNFISGFEMELATARWVRDRFEGPIYADLHSLFLGVTLGGERIERELPDSIDWLQSFNAVQMNETEFDLLGGAAGDPWRLAADALGDPLKLVAVTTGPRGAAFVASSDFRPDPMTWGSAGDATLKRSGRPASVARLSSALGIDPTGCGDVWGATMFGRLLAGDPLEKAMRGANQAASRNAQLKGAGSLQEHFASGPSHRDNAP